jgi:hypothetical protein
LKIWEFENLKMGFAGWMNKAPKEQDMNNPRCNRGERPPSSLSTEGAEEKDERQNKRKKFKV